MFPRPDFFAGSLLNFTQNLLYPAKTDIDEHSTAIIEVTETGHSAISWAELRERVRKCALALRTQGVKPLDRVAGFLGNHANTVIAMLATASIGAVWTGVSPDTGVTAVLERLVQIEPEVLFVDNAVYYNGKVHSSHQKTVEIVRGLQGLKAVVMFETVNGHESDISGLNGKRKAYTYDQFVNM
jgi:acetoacetyl-CoA synthetase